MRVKKTSRKNVVRSEEKENVNFINDIEEHRGEILDIISNNSEGTDSFSLSLTINNEEGYNSSEIQELGKENQQTVEAIDDFNAFIDFIKKEEDGNNESKWEHMPSGDTQHEDSSSCRGEKRPFDRIENLTDNENASSQSKNAPVDDSMILQKKRKTLIERTKELEAEGMPIPQPPTVIEDIIETSDVLRNMGKNSNEKPDQYIWQLMKSLNLEKQNLSKFKKRTATATSRAIIRCRYPNPAENFCFRDVDSLTIDNIIKLTKYLNPTDVSSNTKLKKSIGNYFASVKFARKMKSKSNGNEETGKKDHNIIQ